MDEEQAVFEQLTLSDSKKWSSAALKMMKNASYFTLKALLVIQILKFLSSIFGHVEKRLD